MKRLVAIVALAGASMALPETGLSGYWQYRVPDGGSAFYLIQQEGEKVTATVQPPGRVFSGTLRGGKLELSSPVQYGKETFMATMAGTETKAGAFDVVAENPGRLGTKFETHGVLTPVSKEAVYPARLPLPALRSLPDNGLLRTPPMGWNTWSNFHDQIDDKTVREMSDALVESGMAKAGYRYVIIDEGWSSSRDATGNIVGNARFPDMKALADYVHARGLKIGIYTSPGPQACGGYQGSYGHEEQDAKQFAEWGYDYVKDDWCYANRVYQLTAADLQGAYQKMGEALARTGRPMVFSLCEYGFGSVWKWGAQAGANLWRTTLDLHDSWESMDEIGFAQLTITQYPVAGHWNDPDFLQVGIGGMTGDEYRTHMSLWALLRAPLIAGNDVRKMTEETKSILMNQEVIAIDQDPAALPVERRAPQGKSEVLTRPLANEAYAVGLFNRGSEPVQISFRWDSLKLEAVLAGKTLEARDLWKHVSVPVEGDEYTSTVPAHGVVLLRVAARPFQAP
jgi:alpha-galactosidase